VPLEERIKNAIQNSFQKHKTTLSLKNLGMGPTLPLHICRLNYVVRVTPAQEPMLLGETGRCMLYILTRVVGVNDTPNQVYLDLSRNKLTELPEDLSALRLLKRLNVSANKLTSLPGSIFAAFPRLHSLIGAENQITEIPEGLFKATTLSYLDLSSNKISKAHTRTFKSMPLCGPSF
jgi:Leucine-rich repeat (LRR) protein